MPSRNRNAVQFSGQALASGLESLKNAPRAVSTGHYTVEPGVAVSFTEADTPNNVWYSEDGTIKAATFSKLVEKLTAEKLTVGLYSFGFNLQTDLSQTLTTFC